MNERPQDVQTADARRLRVVRTVIILLVLFNAVLLALWLYLRPRPNHNALAIGPAADPAITEPLRLAIRAPAELDYLARADVLALREQEVQCYNGLAAGDYVPSDAVFGGIEDNRPWWGIQGQYFYGPGEDSTAGPSEEARFLLNPYLLVAADFYGLSIWGDPALWDGSRISPADLERADFPWYCPPQDLLWWPGESRAEVSYDVSRYLPAINAWSSRVLTLQDAVFDITAWNARDWNFASIQVIQAESSGIRISEPFDIPIEAREFIHRGGSCGFPGGCNNAIPYVPEFSGMALETLPARLVVHLWYEPGPEAGAVPDFIFSINFR